MSDTQPTFAEATQRISAMGMTIEKTPGATEYRVDFPAGQPGHVPGDIGTAYFAEDLTDAVNTAGEMRKQFEASRTLELAEDRGEFPVAASSERESQTVGRVRDTFAALDHGSETAASKGRDLAAMADQSAARVAARSEKPEAERATLTR